MAWKTQVRVGLKNLQNQLRQFSSRYARGLDLVTAGEHPYLWHISETKIPQRGTPEIRANRLANLQQGVKKIDRLLLRPGQRFSFSYCVGHPNLKNGFQAGPVFIGGQVKTGLGGGLCLLATNLFQLFLYSGCKIIERHCHSIDTYGNERFYRLGEDAAVAYGYKDLIVANPTEIGLFLRLQVFPDSGLVQSQLWGNSPCPWHIKIESILLEEIPAPAATWLPGSQVQTQRYIQAKDNNPPSSAAWVCDYAATSLYQPCLNSCPLTASALIS